MDNSFGFPKETVEFLESKLDQFTFDSLVERLDQVFQKGWSLHLQGPEIVQVPKRVPKFPKAKNPTAFVYKDIPHWQCLCSIAIHWPDKYNEIVREYSVCVPVEEGSFEMARDLAFIYTAYYGLGVGKKSKDIFTPEKKVEIQVGDSTEIITTAIKELETIKRKLNIKANKDLDIFVKEWNSELSSHEQINRTNLKDFILFLRTKLEENVG